MGGGCEEEEKGEGDEEKEKEEERVCFCGRGAVLRQVGQKGQNRGLRYWACDGGFIPFKRNPHACRFFEWVDVPRVTMEQKKEARAKRYKKLKAWAEDREQQTSVNTRAAVKSRHTCSEEVDDNIVIDDSHKHEIEGFMPLLHNAKHNEGGCAKVESAKETNIPKEENHVYEDIGRGENETSIIMASQDLLNIEKTNTPEEENYVYKDICNGENETSIIMPSQDLLVSLPSNKIGDDSRLSVDSESLDAHIENPLCFCSQRSILKVVQSQSPNKGLRYWICANARPPFSKIKGRGIGSTKSCRFFRWLDTPILKSEGEKEKEKQKKKERKRQQELKLLS